MGSWSIEETHLLKKYYMSGMTYDAISKKLFRSRSSICSKIYSTSYYKIEIKRESINFETIINRVSRYSGINKTLLLSTTQKREIVQYRQLCHYFAKNKTRGSLDVIGYEIGKKDHATVLHSVKAVENGIDTDPKFRRIVEELSVLIDKDVFNKENKSVRKVQQKQQILLIKNSISNIHVKIELNDLIKRLDEQEGS